MKIALIDQGYGDGCLAQGLGSPQAAKTTADNYHLMDRTLSHEWREL